MSTSRATNTVINRLNTLVHQDDATVRYQTICRQTNLRSVILGQSFRGLSNW